MRLSILFRGYRCAHTRIAQLVYANRSSSPDARALLERASRVFKRAMDA